MTMYRTYRPRHFHDVLGQPAAVATLQGALRKHRVGHAYLLSGPRGTGKTSTARIFARAACCLDLQSRDSAPEPCDVCANCRALLEGHATDFNEIDAASNRGIEDVRTVREDAQYPPVLLPYRVYVIDEVHMLTVEAFNALLKLLEEPPAHCLFLLATTELQKVPLTVRSRCQTITFRASPPEFIVEKLAAIAESERIRVDRTALELLAEHAEGGFRDAETLFEQLASGNDELNAAVVEEALGVVPREQIQALLQATLSGQAPAVRSALRDIPVGRGGVIRQLLEHIRGRMYEAATPAADMDRLQSAFERLLDAYILQRSAPSPRLALEAACFALCLPEPAAPEPSRPIAQPAPVLAAPVRPIEAKPVVPVVDIVDKPQLPTERLNDIRKAWKEMAERICRENAVLGGTLKQAVFHTAGDHAITVHVRFKFHADKFNEKKNRERIADLLRELTGEQWDVRYEVNANLPKRAPAKQVGTGREDAVAVFGEVG